MKKLIYLFGLVAILLTSCSGDDDTNSGDSNSVLVKKAMSVDPNGGQGITFTYTYNGNKINMVEVSNGQKVKYFYSGNLITKAERYSFDGSDLVGETVYQYDANERLIEEEYKDFFNSWLETRMYSYEEDGTISFLQYTGELGSITELARTGKYFFNEENEVVKVEYANVGPNISTITNNYTYDNKNCVFKNVLGWNKIFSTPDGKKHNVLSSSTVDSDQVVLEQYSNQYEYNSAGYPTSLMTTIGTTTTRVDYFY